MTTNTVYLQSGQIKNRWRHELIVSIMKLAEL